MAACGGNSSLNPVLETVELVRADAIWEIVPAMRLAPELENVKGAGYAVIFANDWQGLLMGRTGLQLEVVKPAPGTAVVCVIDGEGTPNIYTNVPLNGYRPASD